MRKKLNTNPILRRKIKTLYNFIEINEEATIDELFKPICDNANATADMYYENTYVLYFGRYAPEKGIDTLLNVVLKLPEIHFVFAGAGPLENEVNELENITNKGFISGSELNNLIRGAEFAVFPSEWYENCPFAVMEALSLGTPVVAADIGGIPELIRAGVNGDLFISGDADDLREKIYLLWNEPDRRNAYQAACNKSLFLSLDEYCQRLLEEIYE
jgi:glycosyltransferase involved in cell wall biosynthesis